jgi:hypothetical protein
VPTLGDRDWVVETLLDLEATEGELQAAMRAATAARIEGAFTELRLRREWDELRLRDVRGKVAHMREQWPGIERLPRD